MLLLIIFIAGCKTNEGCRFLKDEKPIIEIQSHSDESSFSEDDIIRFYAQSSDKNHKTEDLSISWYVDEEKVCDWAAPDPDGISRCDITLKNDDTLINVVVLDPWDGSGRDEISITVNPTAAPTVEIHSPTEGENYIADQLIEFSATISDEEDDVEDLVAVWNSSSEGELALDTTVDGNGKIEDFGYLSPGEHAIELCVTDTSGKTTSVSVVLDIAGQEKR